jgi:tetratricopeptide (TPR) repeat protein
MIRASALALVLGLALMLVGVPVPAAPAKGPASTREEARAALGDKKDDARRRQAVLVLAERGTMDDVPALVGALRDADAAVRELAERALWQVWSRSGDEDIDRLLAVGIEQMDTQDGEAAVKTFTRVIERRPEFAEGWNKRATVYYLMGEFKKSLADCDEVMKRNRYHFGALSGYGMIYLRLGEPARALEYFERALDVNPNMESVREAVENVRRLLIEQRKKTI